MFTTLLMAVWGLGVLLSGAQACVVGAVTCKDSCCHTRVASAGIGVVPCCVEMAAESDEIQISQPSLSGFVMAHRSFTVIVPERAGRMARFHAPTPWVHAPSYLMLNVIRC